MLLRTTSTPSLRSSPSSPPESDPNLWTQRTRPFSLTLSPPPPGKKILRTTSVEADLFKGLPLKPGKGLFPAEPAVPTEEPESSAGTETAPFLLSCSVGAAEERTGLPLEGGAGDGGGGGAACGGGGAGDWEWGGRGSESLDEHYQSLIKSYPGDALLLGNYARFLKEVKGHAERAEELCERAILANRGSEPVDGNVLSLYGDLIWKKHNDAPRASSYFEQALQSSPDDCYVLASYARFLWDSGEEDEEEEQKEQIEKQGTNENKTCRFPPTADDQNVPAAC